MKQFPLIEPEEIGENFSIRLETNGIEAKALIRILQDTHLTFREIAKAEDQPEADLKIYPFKEGSFEFSAAILAAKNIATTTIGVFREILGYKKARLEYEKSKQEAFRKGQESNKIKFEVEIPQALQKNANITLYMNAMLKTIGDNSEGFNFSGSGTGEPLHLTSSDIRSIIESEKDHDLKPVEKRSIEMKDARLSLVKISDKPYGKWDFIYDGIKIKVDVPEYLKYLALTEKYKPGIIFNALLTIRQEYNSDAKAWQNIGYRISQVTQV